jgi:hypothetical protein
MDPTLLIFPNGLKLLTQVDRIEVNEIGEPDCLMIEPFQVIEGKPYENGTIPLSLKPWLVDHTLQNKFKIHSDKILTIVEPNNKLKKMYEDAFAVSSSTKSTDPILLNECKSSTHQSSK